MILVTGGAGFIGSHLVRGFLAHGDPVRVLDDFSTGNRENLVEVADDIELIEGRITDEAAVAQAMKGVRVVVHQAACPSVVLSTEQPRFVHDSNATGTLVVLDQAARAGVEKLLFAGSSAVYGPAGDAPTTEDDPVLPLSPYGAQKLMGEHYCRIWSEVHGLPTVVLRYFNVFGPRQDPSSPYSGVISIFCDRLLAGEGVRVDGDGLQTRDFTYVDDVVQANLAAAQAPLAGHHVFNVATGSSVTIRRLYDEVAGLLGVDAEPEYGPSRAGDVYQSRADVRRAREVLGFEATVDFSTGLAQTLAWSRGAAGDGSSSASHRSDVEPNAEGEGAP